MRGPPVLSCLSINYAMVVSPKKHGYLKFPSYSQHRNSQSAINPIKSPFFLAKSPFVYMFLTIFLYIPMVFRVPHLTFSM